MTCRICHGLLETLWESEDGLCDSCSKAMDADLDEMFGELEDE